MRDSIYTLPRHRRQSTAEIVLESASAAMHTENVVRQQRAPRQTCPSSGAFCAGPIARSARNAYRYENAVVPTNGAYEMMPKLRPRFAGP